MLKQWNVLGFYIELTSDPIAWYTPYLAVNTMCSYPSFSFGFLKWMLTIERKPRS